MDRTAFRHVLVADSGATKCSWALLERSCGQDGASGDVAREVLRYETCGLNAAVASAEDVRAFAAEASRHLSPASVSEIWIYAAGAASGGLSEDIVRAFGLLFRNAEVNVASDMLGAARAVCGSAPGTVGILGTGSNCCLYDGKDIAVQGLGGGYVLGDEGSGAWVGKRLLSDFIRGLLPSSMSGALRSEHALDYPAIVENVYRSGTPGRYLASFFPFVLGCSSGADASGEYASALLREGFEAFLDRCIQGLRGYAEYPLNLCGSVAWLCRDIIADCARERGIRMGTVLKSPIDGLAAYHGRTRGRVETI